MAAPGVTIRAVQALEAGATIWDSGHKEAVRGFGVRRQRGTPVYVIKYRVFGRQRFFTIGPHGSPWTPAKARKEAKRLLGLVADGKDPADHRAQAGLQAAETLRKIADEYLKRAKQKQRPRTYLETKRYLLSSWKPLHPVSVFHIRRHIAARLADMVTDQGPVAAARARTALSAMFNWAIREGYDIAANPVLGTNRPAQPKSRDRVLTDTELDEIWAACGADDYGRIVRLLMLTAQRRDEVGGMRRSEINAAEKLWTIPGSRTKNHREHSLPISDAAAAIIDAAMKETSRDFAFGEGPRRKDDKHRGYSGWSKSKAALDARLLRERRKAIGEDAEPLPAWTLHDLRRTAATGMADRLGVFPHVVEAILNHISGHRAGVAGVYNRARYLAEMRDALGRWGDYVEALKVTLVPATPRPKSRRLVRI
jgi:integrase